MRVGDGLQCSDHNNFSARTEGDDAASQWLWLTSFENETTDSAMDAVSHPERLDEHWSGIIGSLATLVSIESDL